jgi:hypothetical protein
VRGGNAGGVAAAAPGRGAVTPGLARLIDGGGARIAAYEDLDEQSEPRGFKVKLHAYSAGGSAFSSRLASPTGNAPIDPG